jgi:hypothetical protein
MGQKLPPTPSEPLHYQPAGLGQFFADLARRCRGSRTVWRTCLCASLRLTVPATTEAASAGDASLTFLRRVARAGGLGDLIDNPRRALSLCPQLSTNRFCLDRLSVATSSLAAFLLPFHGRASKLSEKNSHLIANPRGAGHPREKFSRMLASGLARQVNGPQSPPAGLT